MSKKTTVEAVETAVEETTAEAVETAVEETTVEAKTEKITLFKDNKDYKDDVFVCINGRNMVVKRGEEVEIPVAYAKVLKQSLEQDMKTARLMDKMQDDYREEAKKN